MSIGISILVLSLAVGIGLFIAIVPCSLIWYFSKKLPMWLRLLSITLTAALLSTPVGVSSEGGGAIVPSICVLPDFVYNNHDTSQSHAGLPELIAIGVMWGILYLITMAVLEIVRFVKKARAYQISDDQSSLLSSVSNSPESPRLASGKTPDEKLASLVKKPQQSSSE